MIEKEVVEAIVAAQLADGDCYLVDVQVKGDNLITVEIDNDEGVDIDMCVKLHRHIESQLDREVEDYELEVGSAGVTSPFKVLRQYEKNIGNEVEVLCKSGMKHTGVLKEANESHFVVAISRMIKTETSKRKVEVIEDTTFDYNEIKYTKYLIRFK